MNITTVYADDWHGIYISGNLVYQGHEIEYDTLLTMLQTRKLLIDGVTWTDEPVSTLVFRHNDNELPANLDDALKYNTGRHVITYGDFVELYSDGKLVKKMPKAEYDLIVSYATGEETE
jgi:hypothetical protein